MQQLQLGDRYSDSVYFTPSDTPMRELEPASMGSIPPSVSLKSTPFNDFDAYSVIYNQQKQSSGEFVKTHHRVKSLTQFLPSGWFAGANRGSSKEVQVHTDSTKKKPSGA